MSQMEKFIKRFKKKPETLKFKEIEKILLFLNFKKINARGSHIKFKHSELNKDIIIPVHNNECKNFYKKYVLKTITKILKQHEN